MVLQDSVEASSDMRDAGDVCLDEVWEDGMLSVSAWLGPCSQSISTSCSSANRFVICWGGGGAVLWLRVRGSAVGGFVAPSTCYSANGSCQQTNLPEAASHFDPGGG